MLICLVILGILAGIVYPSYQNFLMQARRADAQNELIKGQIEQSSYRIMHSNFIHKAASAGLPSNHPYYTFSIVSASVNTYSMKATAIKTGSQNNDQKACKTLFIDQNSHKTSDGKIDNAFCWKSR